MQRKNGYDAIKACGIDIRLTSKGMERLARMMGDGCPHSISSNGVILSRKSCPVGLSNDKNSCFICWYRYLEKHSIIYMEE